MNVGNLHGYKIATIDAARFWTSDHKCNRAKAVVAFSKTLEEANANLRRMGYKNLYRKRAIAAMAPFLNQPAMGSIPYSTGADKWWDCMFKPQGKGKFVKWKLDSNIDGHWGRAYFNNGDYLFIGPSGAVDSKTPLTAGHIYQYQGASVSGVPFTDVLKDMVDKGVYVPSAEKYNINGSSSMQEFYKWFDPDKWMAGFVWKE